MNWTLKFLPEAQKDFEQIAGNQKLLVAKALDKVVQNPVSIYEGGYGKPLGSKSGTDLSGLLKIKLRDAGLRIVYKLVRTETSMLVIVIGARADDAVLTSTNYKRLCPFFGQSLLLIFTFSSGTRRNYAGMLSAVLWS